MNCNQRKNPGFQSLSMLSMLSMLSVLSMLSMLSIFEYVGLPVIRHSYML